MDAAKLEGLTAKVDALLKVRSKPKRAIGLLCRLLLRLAAKAI
jgi:hypothetical protein